MLSESVHIRIATIRNSGLWIGVFPAAARKHSFKMRFLHGVQICVHICANPVGETSESQLEWALRDGI